MKIYHLLKVLVSHYKQDLVKNLSNSITWLGLLLFLAKYTEGLHTSHWWLLVLEILVALLHPVVFIIGVLSSDNKKLTIAEINQLTTVSEKIVEQRNEQKFFSLLAYMRRNNRMVKQIREGVITLVVHQNYQYARRVFESVLKGVAKEGGYYITLSSLSFWGKEPWHNNSTRAEYISMNLEEVNKGKHIRRVIAIDKELLLSESQVRKSHQSDPEKVKQLLSDKETLKHILSDFKKSEIMKYRRYDEKLFTLFYAMSEEELKEIGKALSSVIVINKELTELVFITTSNLTPSDKSASIKGVYTKIKGGLKNRPGMSYDTKHLLSDIQDEFNMTKSSGKVSFPDVADDKSAVKADCYFILQKYKEIFDMIHHHTASGEFKNEAGMYTIEKLSEMMGV